jgi:nucleoid DNA-binding protein
MAKMSNGNKGTKVRAKTKSLMYQELADKTQLSRKQVAAVLDALAEFVKNELGNKKGAGVATLPGLVKIYRREKPATKERQGRNPQTGETITISAKPKSTTVRARVLKALKDLVK